MKLDKKYFTLSMEINNFSNRSHSSGVSVITSPSMNSEF